MRLHQELVLGVGGVRALRALGLDAGGLAPERGPLGLPARRAGPRAGRRRRAASRTPGSRSAATASSRSTRRSRPATSGSTPTWSGVSPGRCSTRAACPVERVLELGLGTDGDRGQFDMTAFSLRLTQRRQRRQPAPRRDRQRDVAGHHRARRSSASRTASTAPPGSGRRSWSCCRATSTRTSTSSTRAPGRTASGSAWSAGPVGGPVGGAPAPEARARDLRPRPAAQPVRPPRRGARRCWRELETAFDPGVFTIGFARRFATYKRAGPAVQRHGPSAPAPAGMPTGRSRSSSPARPTRPTAPASGSSRRSSSARARPSCAVASSSSRTTTCASAGSSCRASTSG